MTISDRVYYQIKNDLEGCEILTDGNRLMTEPRLSKRYNVAVGTLRKAISRLENEGVVERQHGRGTFLCGESSVSFTPELSYACPYALFSQNEINRRLFEGKVKPLALPGNYIYYELQGISPVPDIIFTSNRPLYYKSLHSEFSPMPPEFASRIERDYDAVTLELFRSPVSGELLGIPLIANPAPVYLNTAIFKKHGIPLPSHEWTLDDFLQTARELKKCGVMPFLYLNSSGHFIEPFFRIAGGTFFDFFGEPVFELEALERLVDFIATLFDEKLIANGFAGVVSYFQILASEHAAMTMCAPHLALRLPEDQRKKWSYWELPQDKASGGFCTYFGLAVPSGASNKAAAWKYLEETVYNQRISEMAEIPGVFPARKNEQEIWQFSEIQNSYIMLKEARRALPLPYKQPVDNFFKNIMEMSENPDNIKNIRMKLIKDLRLL